MKMLDLKKMCKLTLDENTATPYYGRFTVEPFECGYGHTIGNSLRRILLSSLEGAAITSVKIAGALHEFAVLEGVKEDITQIILNLKKIRVKILSKSDNNFEKLFLKVKKTGKIIAKDIALNPNVEIMNPEQEIANLDHEAILEMELMVSSGKGYVLAEEMSQNELSTIPIDALFSPINKVNYEVENTRVEQILNYERLVIEIWSDGTINPKDALLKSAKILIDSLAIFTNGLNSCEKEISKKDFLCQSLNIMNLSTRILNTLKNAGIMTIQDLVKLKDEDLLNLNNFGKSSFEEVKNKLAKLNLCIKE
ncbi:MAG: DNA-directed RNA polymerase subunit alpha [Endomicrobium sp.]|jgi:DNA-directed RNA polymerase subunit alpha|nr:DNA-directed RNA polymerase subunit alpha [Endomicrobium sp.]